MFPDGGFVLLFSVLPCSLWHACWQQRFHTEDSSAPYHHAFPSIHPSSLDLQGHDGVVTPYPFFFGFSPLWCNIVQFHKNTPCYCCSLSPMLFCQFPPSQFLSSGRAKKLLSKRRFYFLFLRFATFLSVHIVLSTSHHSSDAPSDFKRAYNRALVLSGADWVNGLNVQVKRNVHSHRALDCVYDNTDPQISCVAGKNYQKLTKGE